MTAEAALIGLFSALLGVALSNGLAALLELRRRHQRTRDLLCAIHAEILAGVGSGSKQLTHEERTYALSNDTPFGTPDETDFVFESVKADLSMLPVDVIHSVVQYYRLAAQSNLMTRDLRDPLFLSQTSDERRKFVVQLLDVAGSQRLAGLRALVDIETVGARLDLNLAIQRSRAIETVPGDSLRAGRTVTSAGGSDQS